MKTNVLKTDERNRQKINEKLRSVEVDKHNKTDKIEMEKLQREVENIGKSIRKLGVRTKKINYGQL